jgi:putative lipoprotein (rSAM/lipoprotein system)
MDRRQEESNRACSNCRSAKEENKRSAVKLTKIITGLLALLGFAGCGDDGDDGGGGGDGRMEYGTPYASFDIKGKVTDEAGDPVEDIKVVIRDANISDPEYSLAVGITDARGYYSIGGGWFGDDTLTVSVEDIDGDKNGGEFASETVELEIEEEDYVGGDDWDRGKVTKTADFELELKTQENADE